jgi:hypothetical protein
MGAIISYCIRFPALSQEMQKLHFYCAKRFNTARLAASFPRIERPRGEYLAILPRGLLFLSGVPQTRIPSRSGAGAS